MLRFGMRSRYQAAPLGARTLKLRSARDPAADTGNPVLERAPYALVTPVVRISAKVQAPAVATGPACGDTAARIRAVFVVRRMSKVLVIEVTPMRTRPG